MSLSPENYNTIEFKNHVAWCKDFLVTGNGIESTGSCCTKDEDIFYGWCKNDSNKDSIYYNEACDVSFEKFGHRSLIIDRITLDLREPTNNELEDVTQATPFCDVLGREQRKWLRKAVQESTSTLKLFISGSVVFNNPEKSNTHCRRLYNNVTDTSISCRCSGDDLDCYRVAQKELIYIASHGSGCSVFITGAIYINKLLLIYYNQCI